MQLRILLKPLGEIMFEDLKASNLWIVGENECCDDCYYLKNIKWDIYIKNFNTLQ